MQMISLGSLLFNCSYVDTCLPIRVVGSVCAVAIEMGVLVPFV